MISSINGRVAESMGDSLVVEVGGVGLEIFTTADLCHQAEVGKLVSLQTYLVVRETELSLYGFSTREEREFFILLLGVNGVVVIGHGRSGAYAVKQAVGQARGMVEKQVVQAIVAGLQ